MHLLFAIMIAVPHALKGFRFKPATKDGVPVPVLINFLLEFNTRDGPPK